MRMRVGQMNHDLLDWYLYFSVREWLMSASVWFYRFYSEITSFPSSVSPYFELTWDVESKTEMRPTKELLLWMLTESYAGFGHWVADVLLLRFGERIWRATWPWQGWWALLIKKSTPTPTPKATQNAPIEVEIYFAIHGEHVCTLLMAWLGKLLRNLSIHFIMEWGLTRILTSHSSKVSIGR